MAELQRGDGPGNYNIPKITVRSRVALYEHATAPDGVEIAFVTTTAKEGFPVTVTMSRDEALAFAAAMSLALRSPAGVSHCHIVEHCELKTAVPIQESN